MRDVRMTMERRSAEPRSPRTPEQAMKLLVCPECGCEMSVSASLNPKCPCGAAPDVQVRRRARESGAGD